SSLRLRGTALPANAATPGPRHSTRYSDRIRHEKSTDRARRNEGSCSPVVGHVRPGNGAGPVALRCQAAVRAVSAFWLRGAGVFRTIHSRNSPAGGFQIASAAEGALTSN